jgi:phenylacetic acid degradation operon negative regulatory protein
MQASNTEPGRGPPALTARSVLASTLLGVDPPELPVAHLLRMAGLFGINANRARVALSRMVASGEAATDGAGHYRLSGHLLARQRRQSASRAGRTGRWSGRWHLVVLTAVGDSAEVRGRRRRALWAARLGELRQGVWTRPDNLAIEADGALDGATCFLGEPTGDGVALAAALWDLEGWARRAEGLVWEMRAMSPSTPGHLAPGFVLSAAVLRHLQADPLLPEALVPPRWPGTELRRVYDDFDARYRAVLSDWARRLE